MHEANVVRVIRGHKQSLTIKKGQPGEVGLLYWLWGLVHPATATAGLGAAATALAEITLATIACALRCRMRLTRAFVERTALATTLCAVALATIACTTAITWLVAVWLE